MPTPRSQAKAGEHNPSSRLTELQVAKIKLIAIQPGLKHGWRKRLAEKYGISPQALSDIVTGKKWKHVKIYNPMTKEMQ